jgi:phosphatidylserine/phosphatidylglycerophosphate/cardiolipin synthase-like enzyme
MNVALRAIHEGLGSHGDRSERWALFVSHLIGRCGSDPVLDVDTVKPCLVSSGLTVSATEWLRHLHALAVVDGSGRVNRQRATDVGTALDLVGDSFDIPAPRANWAPVATLPTEIRFLMRPQPLRQTAGVLLGLIDRSVESLMLAAPFIDSPAVAFLRESIAASLRRGVRVHVLTSSGRGRELNHLIHDACRSRNGRLVVTEVHTEMSSLGSHAKVLLVDRTEAYVGSANLTAAGLGRHVEIGVELSGPQVEDLARLLDAVERLGTRMVSVADGVVRD